MAAHAVCEVGDLPVGAMKAFRAGSARVVVYHLAEGWFATQAQCTHTFAPLARGTIQDGCQIRCPLHRARFDIATGKVVEWANFPVGIQLLDGLRGAKPLRTYPVRIRAGKVMVTI
jgi:3-phenylpropionate/trans-cinnamate dioxygenase ferredoxin subunit